MLSNQRPTFALIIRLRIKLKPRAILRERSPIVKASLSALSPAMPSHPHLFYSLTNSLCSKCLSKVEGLIESLRIIPHSLLRL